LIFLVSSGVPYIKGLKKVPSVRLGQVDFPAGKVPFHYHVSDGLGPGQVVCQLNKKSQLDFPKGSKI